MRMAELSTRSAVSVPTLKFYLREGLLPAGRPTARNQAEYDDLHVQRVRLIRALVDIGGLSIAAVRDVVAAVDAPRRSVESVVGVVHHALTPPSGVPDDAALTAARSEVDGWLAELGWQVSARAPARRTLAEALVSLRRLGRAAVPPDFAAYASAADQLAAWELDQTLGDPPDSRAELVERVVVGTVVYEAVLLALRRLAQEHQFALRSSVAGQTGAGGTGAGPARRRPYDQGRR
jgi:DNA-binding transcriptional MerR regulator